MHDGMGPWIELVPSRLFIIICWCCGSPWFWLLLFGALEAVPGRRHHFNLDMCYVEVSVCDVMVIILKSSPLQYLNSIQGQQRQACMCIWLEITIVTGAWTCNGIGAKHHSKLFKCIDALQSQNNPMRCKYYSDFTDEETWGPEMSNLPEVTQLINGRARIQTQAAWLICL